MTAKVGDGTARSASPRRPITRSATRSGSSCRAPKPVRFPLYLRVPRWSGKPAVQVNGQAVATCRPGRSPTLCIDADWPDGDVVALQLPMHVAVHTLDQEQGRRLGGLRPADVLPEDRRAVGGAAAAATPGRSGRYFPRRPGTTAWCWTRSDPAASFEVVRRDGPVPAAAVHAGGVPIELRVKAQRIPNWTLDTNGWCTCCSPARCSPTSRRRR